MKKFLLATLAAVALAGGSASAADLARPAMRPAPPVAPIYTWTGFYWGVNIGYSWGQVENDWIFFGFPTASESQDIDGVIGGFQSGINWQTGIWVFGLESDIQASHQKGDSSYCVVSCAILNVNAEHKLPWFGTSRTRIGFLATPNILLYATGGVAYGQVKSTYTLNVATTPVAAVNFKETRAGWTAGAGIEGAFGGGWSAKLEYLYIDLGEHTTTATLGPTTVFTWNKDVTDHIVRVGLNYKWGPIR
jgi:outer membrane immunogenic protein